MQLNIIVYKYGYFRENIVENDERTMLLRLPIYLYV